MNANANSDEFLRISSPNKLLKRIETLESRLTKLKQKTDYPNDKESLIFINKLSLFYNKQGFLYFQQNQKK